MSLTILWLTLLFSFPFTPETWTRWDVVCQQRYAAGQPLPDWAMRQEYVTLFAWYLGKPMESATVNVACENYAKYRAWRRGS